jgi:hypothetical protein
MGPEEVQSLSTRGHRIPVHDPLGMCANRGRRERWSIKF